LTAAEFKQLLWTTWVKQKPVFSVTPDINTHAKKVGEIILRPWC
jgi:hypothetical protein